MSALGQQETPSPPSFDYPSLQCSREVLLKYIGTFLKEGKTFDEIGQIFHGVRGAAIKYHWDRYKLGIYKTQEKKFKLTKRQQKAIKAFARRVASGKTDKKDRQTIHYFLRIKNVY